MPLHLYHCTRARSMRPLWTLEEMGLEYELTVMPFPPRYLYKSYLEVNPLGTVPALVDGEITMTESAGICQYLVDAYGPTDLAVGRDEADYAAYLNWLHRCDATLTFPQTLVLRYTRLEPEETRNPQVAADYRKWFAHRFRSVERALENRTYLCSERFTIADVCVLYCLVLASSLDIDEVFTPNVKRWWDLVTQRPAYRKTFEI
ncbi:MAG: glutathione S-transferase family protein [Gammaproteobacteria bacterium]|nr:glutathione S-transferase family protein [Gammaproteobacteria bacterium]